MKKIFTLFCFVAIIANAHAQPGGQWVPQGENLLTNDYGTNDISVVDENIVWTVACKTNFSTYTFEDCLLLRTIDGGENWTFVDVSGLVFTFIVGVHAISETTAWITTCDGDANQKSIHKTTDGGDTWVAQYSEEVPPNRLFPPAVKFTDEQTGFFIDIWGKASGRTADGGMTWETSDLFTNEAENLFFYWGQLSQQNWWDVKGDTIWWGTSRYIARSINGGVDWEYFFTNLPQNNPIQAIAFNPEGLGLAISDQQTILGYTSISETVVLRSEDFGATWTPLPNVPFPMSIITYIPGTENSFIGVSGEWFTFSEQLGEYVSAFTPDGGETWQMLDQGIARNAIRFASPSLGWAGRVEDFDYGAINPAIFKWEGDLNTDAKEFLKEVNIGVNPNPFTGQTLLEFELNNNTQPVEITITDVLGKVIQTFRFEKPNSGFNRKLLNIEAPAGLLFLTLKQGDGLKTIKLVKQ